SSFRWWPAVLRGRCSLCAYAILLVIKSPIKLIRSTDMADRLAALMAHFPVKAQVFNAGALCGINTLDSKGDLGQLHLVRQGAVEVQYDRRLLQVERPSLLLFPRPLTRRFITDPERGADMVCANLSFEGGAS